MAKAARQLFESDSDDDSVATESTAPSEPEEEYEVERILLEDVIDGETQYLIKWATYPLNRSTWEPPENIHGALVMENWQESKARIRQGLEEPFDISLYDAAVVEYEAEREVRRARRKKKRRRRGITVSPDDTNEENEMLAKPAPKRKVVKQSPVKRKGLAQKIRGRRKPIDVASSSDSDSSGHASDNSDADSLADELAGKATSRDASVAKLPRVRQRNVSSTATKAVPKLPPEPATKPQKEKVKPATQPQEVAKKPPVASARPPQPKASAAPPTVGRKTAPSTGPVAGPAPIAKKKAASHDNFAGWADEPAKKRKSKPRVTSETVSDFRKSSDPKFQSLRQQGIYQKYSRNENAPDPNALNLFNPKTGQPVPRADLAKGQEKQSGEDQQPVTEIHSAYHRRTPPPTARTRSPTPPSPQAGRRNSEVQISQAALNGASKNRTCRHWYLGDCHRGDQCEWAHEVIGDPNAHLETLADREKSCYFWQIKGKCKYSDEECRFAHRWTGILADPPAGYVPKGNEPRRASDKIKTCYFWYKLGSCKVSEEECSFAHRYTGLVADPPAPKQPELPISGPAPERTNSSRRSSTYAEPARPAGRLTCFFWLNNQPEGCTNPKCTYAHYDTGHYAPKPGTSKRGPRASNANLVPLGVPNATRPNEGDHNTAATPRDALQDAGLSYFPTGAVYSGEKVQSPMAMSPHTMTVAQSPLQSIRSPVTMEEDGRVMAISQQPSHVITTAHSTVLPPPPEPIEVAPSVDEVMESMVLDHEIATGDMDATLILGFGSDKPSTSLRVTLHISDITRFERVAGAAPVLEVRHMVIASDFQHLAWTQSAGVESVLGGITIDRSQSEPLDNITDLCKTHSVALVAVLQDGDGHLIIYPSMAEEFKFMQAGATGKLPPTKLCFRSFAEPLDNPVLSILPKDQNLAVLSRQPPKVAVGDLLAGLDHEQLLQPQTKAVFLMLPDSHHAELEMYINYFQESRVKLYHSGTKGAWAYFRKKYTSSYLVVVHPEVPLWRIPGLYEQVLITGSAPIWSVGYNTRNAMLEEREPTFGCERLFPHGMLIYITDDVFIHHTDQAIDILDSYLKQHKFKPAGGENNRIAARPRVKEWLFKLAFENNERGRKDHRWLQLYDQICKLDPEDFEDSALGGDVWRTQLLVTPSLDSMPSYNELWEKDEAEATNFMVDWFASMAVMHASKFRRFMVCYAPKDVPRDKKWNVITDPKGWAEKYQHIGVHAPEDVAVRLKKK